MGEQNTGDTDQATPAISFYKDDPKRQKEIAEIRRHTQLERLWLGVAIIAQLAGTLLISRYVPEPLNLCFVILWGISSWGYIASTFNTLKRSVKQSAHYWQGFIDEMYDVTNEFLINRPNLVELKKRAESALSELRTYRAEYETEAEKTRRLNDDGKALLSQFTEKLKDQQALTENLQARLEAIKDEAQDRRGPGRRPLTKQEIAHELERADRAAAEIEAQGRTPTQQEIAQRLGITPKTLQRYRGRMDNKGQK